MPGHTNNAALNEAAQRERERLSRPLTSGRRTASGVQGGQAMMCPLCFRCLYYTKVDERTSQFLLH